MSIWFGIALWKRVVGGLLLGVIFALVWPSATPAVAFLGDLFVRAIRMLVAPIVLVTIAAGITSLGDAKRLGKLGLRTVGLVAAPTAIATGTRGPWCANPPPRAGPASSPLVPIPTTRPIRLPETFALTFGL